MGDLFVKLNLLRYETKIRYCSENPSNILLTNNLMLINQIRNLFDMFEMKFNRWRIKLRKYYLNQNE